MLDDFASHPVATLVIDPSGIIASANPRAEMLLNMARSALVGMKIERAIRIEDPDLSISLWATDKPLAAYDLRVNAGRVSEVEMDVLISPIADNDSWRVVALHPHSHARKIAFGSARRGGRSAMGAAAMLAHEIKNPLSGIRGAAQLIESSDAQTRASMTALICTEVDRIAALIDRMQDFTTDRPAECIAANIYPLLDQAVDVALAGFGSKVEIARSYDPSLPLAMVNPDGLVQIMINLIKNAVEAVETIKQPSVSVVTSYRHGLSIMSDAGRGTSSLPIEIQVIDNGAGVPDQLKDDLFAPFVTSKPTGQGLGLALVDKLVRDMGGLVQYERLTEGGQSVFRILLPMARQ